MFTVVDVAYILAGRSESDSGAKILTPELKGTEVSNLLNVTT
jgi:hypothetical protein